MSKDLQELVTQFTNEEGQVDWEKANESYNEHINGIVTKNVAKETEKAKESTLQTFISELGIEGKSLDDVKLWTKKMAGNTDEFKETNIKLEKELAEIKEKYDLTTSELNTLRQEMTNSAQLSKIKSLGVDEEQAEFIHYKLSRQVTEEKGFDELFEEYAKEHEQETKPTTTNKFVKRNTGNDVIAESIQKRYPKYFK